MVFTYSIAVFLFCVGIAEMFLILRLSREKGALSRKLTQELEEKQAVEEILSKNKIYIEKLELDSHESDKSHQALKKEYDRIIIDIAQKEEEINALKNRLRENMSYEVRVPPEAKFQENLTEETEVEDRPDPFDGGEANNHSTSYDNVKILVCEDYEQSREAIGSMLSDFGITPEFASNGVECVNILNSGKMFDLIFMDLQMPVMNGYEAARAIRSDSRFDSTPIISLTANSMREIVDQCLESGMNDHIAKPVEFDRLEYALAKWLPENKFI